MAQSLAALALATVSVWAQFVLQQLPDVRQDGPRNDRVQVDRKCASHKVLHCLGTVACNVHHAALVFHECDGAVRNEQSEGDLIQIVWLERAAFEGSDPGFSNLLS